MKKPEVCATQFEQDLPKILLILDCEETMRPVSVYSELKKSIPSYTICSLQVNSRISPTTHSEG